MFVLAALAVGATIGAILEIKSQQAWTEAGRELGLEFTGFLMFKKLEGTLDGFRVRVRPVGKHGFYQIDVIGEGMIPSTLSLGAESIFTRSLDGEDIQTGHPAFDYKARIFGKPEEAVALLESDTRAAVLDAVVEGDARVAGGRISLKKQKFSEAVGLVRRLVALAKRLSVQPHEVPRRLERNAAADPLPTVRLRNLALLQERFADDPAAREASRSALASDSPNLRLAAARFLGREGLEAARALALDAGVEEDLRRQALQLFLHHAQAGEAMRVLDELASDSPAALMPALIEGAERHVHAPALKALLGRLDQLDDEAAASFAGTVERIGTPEAEPGLLSLLARDTDRVRSAAARALGRLGTVRSVEPLLGLTTGLLMAPSVKQAAREAVARIQSRLGDAEAGRLSLAVPAEDAGALSLAGERGEPAGAVSLTSTEEQPGDEPSLPEHRAGDSGQREPA